MEETLQIIIKNLKSITTQDMLGNYSQWNNPAKVLAKDIETLEKALEENEELKKKIKALERALDLIKQKRENAKLDLETAIKHRKQLIGEIEAYTDCIATIEAEMGRDKK